MICYFVVGIWLEAEPDNGVCVLLFCVLMGRSDLAMMIIANTCHNTTTMCGVSLIN